MCINLKIIANNYTNKISICFFLFLLFEFQNTIYMLYNALRYELRNMSLHYYTTEALQIWSGHSCIITLTFMIQNLINSIMMFLY